MSFLYSKNLTSNMKKAITFTFIIITFSTMTQKVFGQCHSKCETINRFDGITVISCEPLPVAGDDNLEAAISLVSNGEEKFIALSVLFNSTTQKLSGNLIIRLKNNSMLQFTAVNSEMNIIGGRQLAQAIYRIDDFIINQLRNHLIYTISFRLEDQILRTFESDLNQGVIKEQLECL